MRIFVWPTRRAHLFQPPTKSLWAKIQVKDRDYFKASMEGKVYISEVLKSKGTGNPVFMVSAPIKENDQITGVLFVFWI